MHNAYALEINEIGDDLSTHPENPILKFDGADLDEDVSRLVLDGIPQGGYKLKPENNKIHFLFSNFQWSFLKDDLLSLSSLRNVKKFTMLEQDNHTVLTIIYDCNCQADVYKWNGKKIVIDIYSVEAVGNPTKTQKWIDKQKQKHQKKESNKPKEPKNIPKQTKKNQGAAPKAQAENTTHKPKSFEDQLKSLLDLAQNEGVVRFKETQVPETKKNPDIQENIAKQDDPLLYASNKSFEQKKNPEEKTKAPQTVNKNVFLSQNTKLDNNDVLPLLPSSQNLMQNQKLKNSQCLPDSMFKLPLNDPKTETFYDNISTYRSKVIGEFDKADQEMSLKLAQYYISYGLGEEAVNVLKNFGAPDYHGQIVLSMAELLVASASLGDSVLAIDKKCSGMQNIWSSYYFYRIGDEARAAKLMENPNAVEAIKDLPLTLQKNIGVALALNLVRKGNFNKAKEIIDLIAYKTKQNDHGVLLVRGLIDAQNGLSERALFTLESVMNKTTGPDQQMVSLSLSELKLAMNKDLNQRDISNLEELIFLKSKSLSGAQALALMAEYYSRKGDFYNAFKRLSQNSYQPKGVKNPVLIKAEQLFRRLAVSGEGIDDPNNIKSYYDFRTLIPNDPALHIAFAKKLSTMGYEIPAYNIYRKLQKVNPEFLKKNDYSYFAGNILYHLGRYKDAYDALSQNYENDFEYTSLKANALHKIGKHKEAFELLKNIENKNSFTHRAHYALYAKEWKAAHGAFEQASSYEKEDKEIFYSKAKATAYMAGHQYPGDANSYDKAVDVIFHQPDHQASGINNIVRETNFLTKFMDKSYHSITKALKVNPRPDILNYE